MNVHGLNLGMIPTRNLGLRQWISSSTTSFVERHPAINMIDNIPVGKSYRLTIRYLGTLSSSIHFHILLMILFEKLLYRYKILLSIFWAIDFLCDVFTYVFIPLDTRSPYILHSLNRGTKME